MKNIFTKGLIGVVAAAGLFLTGCVSLDTVPTSAVSSASVWTNATLANGAVNGVYKELYYDWRNDGYWCAFFDMYTEIGDVDRNWTGGLAPFTMGNSSTSSGLYSNWWKWWYEGIYRANDVLGNIDSVPDMSAADKSRIKGEMYVLRAYWYFRLNALWQGVPIYTEPMILDETTKGRSTAAETWAQVIKDCDAAIAEASLPNKYATNESGYGRMTKGAAYAIRGKANLWLKNWSAAESDFRKVMTLGYSLYPVYGDMFTEEHEKNDEYIMQYQYYDDPGFGTGIARTYGNRNSTGYSWNNLIPNPCFVDSYTYTNGKPFDIEEVIPGYTSKTPVQRIAYYLRDDIYESEKATVAQAGADLSLYLGVGNEARVLSIYNDRDPRQAANFITPYSTYIGGATGTEYEYTMRWPFRYSDKGVVSEVTGEMFWDLRTDTQAKFYYMWRKFVFVGRQHTRQDNSPIDIPIIRYAEVLLGLAEALNEQGKTDDAIPFINQVRDRAGVAGLNTNTYTTVTGQADLRKRIQDEYGWEFAGEGILYYNELRWGTWAKKKFEDCGGMTEIWGAKTYNNQYLGDYSYRWPIPAAEVEMNDAITQNPGWL